MNWTRVAMRAAVMLLCAGAAKAQPAWPVRPVRILVATGQAHLRLLGHRRRPSSGGRTVSTAVGCALDACAVQGRCTRFDRRNERRSGFLLRQHARAGAARAKRQGARHRCHRREAFCAVSSRRCRSGNGWSRRRSCGRSDRSDYLPPSCARFPWRSSSAPHTSIAPPVKNTGINPATAPMAP